MSRTYIELMGVSVYILKSIQLCKAQKCKRYGLTTSLDFLLEKHALSIFAVSFIIARFIYLAIF